MRPFLSTTILWLLLPLSLIISQATFADADFVDFGKASQLLKYASKDQPGVATDDFKTFLEQHPDKMSEPLPQKAEGNYASLLGVDGFRALITSMDKACVSYEANGKTWSKQNPLILPGLNGFTRNYDLGHIMSTYFTVDLTAAGTHGQVVEARASKVMLESHMKTGSMAERNKVEIKAIDDFADNSTNPKIQKLSRAMHDAMDVMSIAEAERAKLKKKMDDMLLKMKDVDKEYDSKMDQAGRSLTTEQDLEICNSTYAAKKKLAMDFFADREKILAGMDLNYERPLKKATEALESLREEYLKSKGDYHAAVYDRPSQRLTPPSRGSGFGDGSSY